MPKKDEVDYVVPKPFPSWLLRVIGASMMIPVVVMVTLKPFSSVETELTVGSAIFAIAGFYLLTGKIPEAPGM